MHIKSRTNNTGEGRNAKIFDWSLDNGYISKPFCFVLEGIPGNETTPVPKIKVYVKVNAEVDDIKKHGEDALLEAIKTLDNVDPVLKYDKDVRYTLTIAFLEPRKSPTEKAENIAASVQFIRYFDNSVLRKHVATVNWDFVNHKTHNLINHTQIGLLLFSKQPGEMEKTANIVVKTLQKYIAENE